MSRLRFLERNVIRIDFQTFFWGGGKGEEESQFFFSRFLLVSESERD